MERIVEVDGNEITVRGLKWKEYKELKADGFSFRDLDPQADNDDWVERVARAGVADDTDVEDLGVSDIYKLFDEICRLTFLRGDAEKN